MAGLTTEQVHAAADELDALGVRPTLAAVRKKLGRGSFSTISDAMSSWRASAAAGLPAPLAPVPEAVSERMGTFAAAVWAAAVAAADEQVAAQREDLAAERAELVATRDQAVAAAGAATAELEQHKTDTAAHLAALSADLDQARDGLQQARREAQQHREQSEAARVQVAELSGQLGALGAERYRLTADLAESQQQIGRLIGKGKPGTGQ